MADRDVRAAAPDSHTDTPADAVGGAAERGRGKVLKEFKKLSPGS